MTSLLSPDRHDEASREGISRVVDGSRITDQRKRGALSMCISFHSCAVKDWCRGGSMSGGGGGAGTDAEQGAKKRSKKKRKVQSFCAESNRRAELWRVEGGLPHESRASGKGEGRYLGPDRWTLAGRWGQLSKSPRFQCSDNCLIRSSAFLPLPARAWTRCLCSAGLDPSLLIRLSGRYFNRQRK